eukprot:12900685-Prorocentrum_lima.AAC.1
MRTARRAIATTVSASPTTTHTAPGLLSQRLPSTMTNATTRELKMTNKTRHTVRSPCNATPSPSLDTS